MQVERGAPEVPCERDLESASEEPGLELRVRGELEPALLPKTLDEGGDLGVRRVRDLNLHPSQPGWLEPWTDADHGPIQHDLARWQRPVLQHEDLASRSDLEELGQWTTSDEGPDPPTDVAVGPERGHVRNGEALRDLLTRTHPSDRGGVRLQRDLGLPADAPQAERTMRARDP